MRLSISAVKFFEVRMLKLVKSFVGFFKPKRGEFLLILISLLLFTAVIVPEFVKMGLSYGRSQDQLRYLWNFSPLLILGVSIGAGLGTFRRDELIKNRWFVGGFILILLYCGFLLNRESLLFHVPSFGSWSRSPNAATTFLVLHGWLMCLLGAMGAWVITKSVSVSIDLASRKFNIATLTRQRLMIGMAVVLFVCLTVRNILDQTGAGPSARNWNTNPILQFLLGGGVLLIGAALPAWAISKIRGGWALLISVVYLGTITGLSTSFASLSVQFMIGIYGLGFSCIVVAMTSYRGWQESNEAPKTVRGFWGLGLLTVALLTTAVLWNFSLSGLLWGGGQRFELARQIKKFSISKGVEAQIAIWSSRGMGAGLVQISADITFQPDVDKTCLSVFANSPYPIGLQLAHVNPELETSHIRSAAKSNCSVSDSRLTFQQMEDLSNTSKYVSISNCQFVESPAASDSEDLNLYSYPGVGRITLGGMPAGETANFLKHLDLSQFAGQPYVGFGSELSEEDWRQILDCSQHFPISVYLWESDQSLPKILIDEAISHNHPSQLRLYGIKPSERDFWELIINTQISVEIDVPISNKNAVEMFWDAAFASRGANWAVIPFEKIATSPADNVVAMSKRHHWIFEENENGEPTGLYLPFGIAHIDLATAWTELKSLSLDPRWLESLRDYNDTEIPRPTDISMLGNLTKLKHLDLPSGLWGADYAFLQKLPELEHLQFDVFVDGRTNNKVNFGFQAADCPNLKSLVLFGKPPKTLALEIAKLPKLESVKLIDINRALKPAGEREQLQKVFGKNISLTIVPLDVDRPELPAAFSAHVERVSEEVQEKYLSGDGDGQNQ